ncbi:MAG: hypothetical protein H8D97_01605 [Proteobacteria bacterium]|nr:hypothetical protein [Pseudomonadota bacterium]
MKTKRFKSFPKISQFRNTIQAVASRVRYEGKDENNEPIFNPTIPLPKLKFEGTVKIHGTHASIHKYSVNESNDNEYYCQSRNNILNYPHNDNAGFGLFMHNIPIKITNLIFNKVSNDTKLTIYGEWAGQNIQSGVGVARIKKSFFIFKACTYIIDKNGDENRKWIDIRNTFSKKELELLNSHNIYTIYQFPIYQFTIDFANPELIQNELIEVTENIEKNCPIANYFGFPNEVGEGAVYSCITPGWESSDLTFKVKGEKHSVSKVKKLASVDPDKVATVNEFVENTVTENRLEQGFQATKELHSGIDLSPKQMRDFIRWVITDILSEEADTMTFNNLTNKCIGSKVARKSKDWFFIRINNQLNDKMGI